MIATKVGKLLTDQPSQPADKRGLVLTCELGKLPDNFDQGFLDNVGKFQPLSKPRSQTGPHDHPQVVPIQGAQLTQRVRLARACSGQQFDRSVGHQRRFYFLNASDRCLRSRLDPWETSSIERGKPTYSPDRAECRALPPFPQDTKEVALPPIGVSRC